MTVRPGYLMDAFDYRMTFVITACIYAVSALMRLPLFFIVPRYEACVQSLHYSTPGLRVMDLGALT